MCISLPIMLQPNGLMNASRTRGLVDLLGACGPSSSLGVRRPVGPLCSSGCRGVESEEGGNASIKRCSSSLSLPVLLDPQNLAQLAHS